jgi:glycosyltransferase involved in cell wall biosynthesis
LHGHTRVKEQLSLEHFDLIIANDIESLPLAFAIDPRAKVLFDAHEYYPRHFEDKLSWRIFFQPFNIYLCKKYIPKVAAMMTVGTGLAREYQKNFGVDPLIITNATWYYEIGPSPVSSNRIRMIHHGGAGASRRLELMIEMMHHLDDRFTLDLMLIIPELSSPKTKNYIHRLRSLADNNPRIRFLPAIKNSDVVSFINGYDLGVFLLPPVNFNYANTLPNKLFEFIQARLGVAIGPTPEMAQIVNEYKIGVVANDFTPESLALELNKLSAADVEKFKANASTPAKELCAEINKEKLLQLIQKIVSL